MNIRMGERIRSGEPQDLNPVVSAKPEVNTKDLLEIFWRGRWLVLLSTLLCVAVGWVYIKRVTPQYTSSSRVFVEQSGPSSPSTTPRGQ